MKVIVDCFSLHTYLGHGFSSFLVLGNTKDSRTVVAPVWFTPIAFKDSSEKLPVQASTYSFKLYFSPRTSFP
jgi:hypothetical protein